ncbi:MAG: hypothetical protein BGN83_18635 [Rhizobium sp. 63-7]|nr:MAG: hypothetical protein BGN83_18635 [Rhizobium sp. 63-7]
MLSTRLVAILLTGLLLSACQTMTPEERRAADEAKCRDYGFRARTESFANCLMKLDLDRRAERRSFRDSAAMDPWYPWGPPLVVERRVIIRD